MYSYIVQCLILRSRVSAAIQFEHAFVVVVVVVVWILFRRICGRQFSVSAANFRALGHLFSGACKSGVGNLLTLRARLSHSPHYSGLAIYHLLILLVSYPL